MPPSKRHQTLPAAQTTSAKEAQKAFHCTLCSKGYTRMNDYEAHLSSYDHTHKQRLRDMKVMTRDPNASSRARKAEAKADGLVSIKIDGTGAGAGAGGSMGAGGFKKGGFKKSGFKNAFTPAAGDPAPDAPAVGEKPPASRVNEAPSSLPKPPLTRSSLEESDTEDEGYELYDPRFPTD